MKRILYLLLFLLIISNKIIAQKITLNEYKKYFDTELQSWANTFTGFKLSEFRKSDSSHFDNNYKQDFKSLKSFLSIYKPLVSFSNDSSKFIDIYSYQLNLEKKGNTYFAMPDVDQAILLCDKKTKYWNRICFGTPGFIIEDATWISEIKFILVACVENDNNERIPIIYLGNTVKQSFEIFKSTNRACIQKSEYMPSKLKRLKIKGL
jgi:hypothetical protein